MNEDSAYCALGRIFGFEPRTAREIVAHLGSASALFELSPKERAQLLGPFSKYRNVNFPLELEQAAEELDAVSRTGCRYLSIGDPRFPAALRECDDAPMGLYLRSDSPPEILFKDDIYIAVVGTRDISPYGGEWCKRIVSAFAECPHKPVIVSGFALGTDITAHRTALECGLRTIAVLPTGIDDVYPHRHTAVAGYLASTPGCALVTDYPAGTSPRAINFLRRNRIIAGLSRATILIESKATGGGLITADFAFGYDRDVFALPGRIDDIRSKGCNALIATEKARPITDIGILVRELGLGSARPGTRKTLEERLAERYPGREDIVSTALTIRSRRAITVDELCDATGRPCRDILALTGILEADGFITMDILQRCTVKY